MRTRCRIGGIQVPKKYLTSKPSVIAMWFHRSMPWPAYDPQTDAALGRFGQGIRRARGQVGLSQRAVALRRGVSQSTISRLENGITAARSIRWLARLFDSIDAEAVHCRHVAEPLERGWSDRA